MNKCFKYSWKFLFYLFLFCIFGSAQPQGIGEPSVYHAVVVIFLEFFAWGLLTTPMLAVSLLFFCQRSAWRLCSPDRTQLLQRRVSVFSHVYPGSNEPVGPQTLCLSPRGLFENLISGGGAQFRDEWTSVAFLVRSLMGGSNTRLLLVCPSDPQHKHFCEQTFKRFSSVLKMNTFDFNQVSLLKRIKKIENWPKCTSFSELLCSSTHPPKNSLRWGDYSWSLQSRWLEVVCQKTSFLNDRDNNILVFCLQKWPNLSDMKWISDSVLKMSRAAYRQIQRLGLLGNGGTKTSCCGSASGPPAVLDVANGVARTCWCSARSVFGLIPLLLKSWVLFLRLIRKLHLSQEESPISTGSNKEKDGAMQMNGV